MLKKFFVIRIISSLLFFTISNFVFSQVNRPAFWAKNYGGSSYENAVAIRPTPDGGRIMCGSTTSNDFDVSGLHGTAQDIWVVKLDNNGEIQWQKTYETTLNEGPNGIILTSDGGYAISGTTSTIAGPANALVLKITATGTLEWSKQIGGSSADRGWQIAQTTDGGFVITGETIGTPNGDFAGLVNHGDYDLFVAKLSSTGTILWAKIFGGTLRERGYVIRQLTDGNILVAGEAVSNNGDVTGNHNDWDAPDFWVLKLTPAGDVIWKKCYGGVGDEIPYNGFEKDNRYYFIGTTRNLFRTSSGDVNGVIDGYDMWFVTLDTAGNLLRQKCIGGTQSVEDGYDIAPTPDNNFVIGGYTMSNDVYVSGNHGDLDFALIKVDSLGNKLWSKLLGTRYRDQAFSVCANADSTYSLLGNVGGVDGDVKRVYGSYDMWLVNYKDTSLTQDLYARIGGSSQVFVGNNIYYTLDLGKNNNAVSSDTVTLHFIKDNRLQLISSSLGVSRTSGDTLFWKLPKLIIKKKESIFLKFGLDPNFAFNPDSLKVKVIIGPYENEFFQTNNVDSLTSKVRYQNAAVTAISVDMQSTPSVGVNQIADFSIRYSFRSLLDTTRWALQLIKDPKIDFVWADPNYTTINGDTITWSFTSTLSQINRSVQLKMKVKDSSVVQIGNVIKNSALLRFNTVDTVLLTKSDTISQTVDFTCVAPDMTSTTLPPSQGIQWQRTFGGSEFEYGRAITAVSDTSFVVIVDGTSKDGDLAGGAGGGNGYAVKYITDGTMAWKKEIGGGGNESFTSIATAENGGIIVAGFTTSTTGPFSGNHGSSDVLLTKLDKEGNIVWRKLLGGSGGESGNILIRKFRNDQYIVLAKTSSHNGNVINPFPDFLPRHWLFVMDSAGNIIWQKVLTDSGMYVADMKVTPDFKFVLAGEKTVNNKSGAAICKIDSTGAILFFMEHANNDRRVGITSVVSNNDSTFTFTGYAQPYIFPGSPSCLGDHGGGDVWVGKTDKDGHLLWQKFYGGSGNEGANHIISANDGGYLLTGLSSSVDGNTSGSHDPSGRNADGWIVKLDDGGRLEWQKMVGGNEHEELWRAIQLPNNEFIVTGTTNSNNTGDVFGNKGENDAWVVKIGASNFIVGAVFFDTNGNRFKESDEPYFMTGTVTSTKAGLVNSSDIKNGFYSVTVDTGTYVTKPVINSPYYNSYPVMDTSRFDGYLQADTVNFAMIPAGLINDLRITLLPVTAARPGFGAQYYIKYENTGTTTITNGSVKLVKDNRANFESASVNPSLIAQDTITWNFNNFEPLQSAEFTVNFRLAIPPALNNGDTLQYHISIDPVEGDTTSLNNRAEVKQVVTGSYDPNDKTETHGPGFEQQKLSNGEYLNYVIRFQNTGTDTAFRVLVRDTLSNKLDWNSFEMVRASHTYSLSITDGNKLEWKFDPIILPDSNHNYAGSNGYVAFRVKPKSDLVLGDTITNRAGIYFDFNLPVLTNVLETIIYPSSLAKPVINGLDASYCRQSRLVVGKISNPQPSNTGITTIVKLDESALAVINDDTFTFDISALAPGRHVVLVKFISGETSTSTEWSFEVTGTAVLNLELSANHTNITSSSQPVIITGTNVSGGSNFLYTFARDRNFIDILQPEGNSNNLTVNSGDLVPGINWIYARLNANGQCYAKETDIDSIQLNMTTSVTGIFDTDAPGKIISIYPVPFHDHLYLKGFSMTNRYEIILVNAQGSRIRTATISNEVSYEFKTPALAGGIYFIHVFKDGKKLGTMKVVKL